MSVLHDSIFFASVHHESLRRLSSARKGSLRTQAHIHASHVDAAIAICPDKSAADMDVIREQFLTRLCNGDLNSQA